jgi:hypothetical protein
VARLPSTDDGTLSGMGASPLPSRPSFRPLVADFIARL